MKHPLGVAVVIGMLCIVVVAGIYMNSARTRAPIQIGQDGTYVTCLDQERRPIRSYQGPRGWRPVPMESFDSFKPKKDSELPAFDTDPCP
jgi:hypothetical protein